MWLTPIERRGFHSVIAIRSVSRSGPTFVSQSNVVPTPRRRRDVSRMATRVVHPVARATRRRSIARHTDGRRRVDVDASPDPGHGVRPAGQPTELMCCAAASGATMLMSTPVPCSNPVVVVNRGTTCTCQWNWSSS